jgi:hypothetical protein
MVCLFVIVCFKIGSPNIAQADLELNYVTQAVVEFEILLPGISGLCHHTQWRVCFLNLCIYLRIYSYYILGQLSNHCGKSFWSHLLFVWKIVEFPFRSTDV